MCLSKLFRIPTRRPLTFCRSSAPSYKAPLSLSFCPQSPEERRRGSVLTKTKRNGKGNLPSDPRLAAPATDTSSLWSLRSLVSSPLDAFRVNERELGIDESNLSLRTHRRLQGLVCEREVLGQSAR